MNFFESQLRRLFGDTEDARFIGRCCFIPADDGNLVKAEFVTQGVHEEYVALQMSVINRADGVIDKTLLRFGDYFSRNSRGQTPSYPVRQRKARMVWSASADKRLERLARCSLRLCPHLLRGFRDGRYVM